MVYTYSYVDVSFHPQPPTRYIHIAYERSIPYHNTSQHNRIYTIFGPYPEILIKYLIIKMTKPLVFK